MTADRVTALRWIHGIGMQTKMNDIGWSYVVIAVMLLLLVFLGWRLWRDW